MFTFANRVVYAVGRVTPNGVNLLGTACLLAKRGAFVTVGHLTGADDRNLVIVLKNYESINDFQDTTDTRVAIVPARMDAIDPISDLCILATDLTTQSNVTVGGVDDLSTGDEVHIFGYPHANHGRLVLTYQRAEVGARVLISNQAVKCKQIVLNVQARPGQSGSPIFFGNPAKLVALLVGSYAPGGGGGISLGGVDPHTLHQTTHAVSAAYLHEMMAK